jgi:hypothetical protein
MQSRRAAAPVERHRHQAHWLGAVSLASGGDSDANIGNLGTGSKDIHLIEDHLSLDGFFDALLLSSRCLLYL